MLGCILFIDVHPAILFAKDGDIDFILAPAVGSLTTATTGTGQGPSTSTIPGERTLFDMLKYIYLWKQIASTFYRCTSYCCLQVSL